jgi:hypothetical protein
MSPVPIVSICILEAFSMPRLAWSAYKIFHEMLGIRMGYLLRGMLFIELGGPEKPMGWASMKSLSGPAHGLEPTAQQLRPLQSPQETAGMTTGLSLHISNIYFHESECFDPRDKVYAIQGLTSKGVDGIEIDYATDLVEIIADCLRIWNTPMTEDQRWYSAYAGLLRKAMGISTERVAEFVRVDCRGDFTRVYADVEMKRIWTLRQSSNPTMFGRAEHTA